MMNISENIRSAYKSLTRNKVRSFLTLTGVIIGIFSITAVTSILGFVQKSVENNLNLMGTNTFYVHIFSISDLIGGSKLRNRKIITYSDYKLLKSRVKSADYIAAGVAADELVSFGQKKSKSRVKIKGVTSDWIHGSGYRLESGRFLTENDVRKSRNIAIIGHDIQKNLMPNISPIGQIIHINGHKLKTVGKLKKKGAMFGETQDNIVILPLSIHYKIFGMPPYGLDSIAVTVKNHSNYTISLDETTTILRQIRKVPFDKKNNFKITTSKSMIEKLNSITLKIKIAAIAVGSVALITAGIGIMNIMLVTVTERTKEIGIRKSIGATRIDILSQFLFEAVILTIMGGVVGMIQGVCVAMAIAQYMKMDTFIPWQWMGIGIVVCTFAGATFGVYPAYKAASLDPVEAIKLI
jgi:putative ABC transport system permease protein